MGRDGVDFSDVEEAPLDEVCDGASWGFPPPIDGDVRKAVSSSALYGDSAVAVCCSRRGER